MKLELRKNLISVLAFVGFVWLIFLVSLPIAPTSWNLAVNFGLRPRSLPGLLGVFTMPFLHDSLEHILGNTIPLAVLLFMLAVTRENAKRVIICLVVLTGLATWLIGWSSPVVGASGLVYALTAYLITAGIHERQVRSAIVAILVGALYGGTLFWRLLPTAGTGVAWDVHLIGAAMGVVFAHFTLRRKVGRVSAETSPSAPAVTASIDSRKADIIVDDD